MGGWLWSDKPRPRQGTLDPVGAIRPSRGIAGMEIPSWRSMMVFRPPRPGAARLVSLPSPALRLLSLGDAMSCGTQVGAKEWFLRSNKGIMALRQAHAHSLGHFLRAEVGPFP